MNGSNEFDKLGRVDLEMKPSFLNCFSGWSESSDITGTGICIHTVNQIL